MITSKKYINKFWAALALLAVAACHDPNIISEDNSIELSETSISASYEGEIFDVDVKANTSWQLTRSSAQGGEVDWVKVDKLYAKGSTSMQIKVLKNPEQEQRTAVLTFTAGTASAFLDVVQEANPNPPVVNPPTPGEDDPIVAQGYDFPMVQRITTGGNVDVESGKVVHYSFDQMPIQEAKIDGGTLSFANGLKVEISEGSFDVVRPCHTNPTKFAGFQEGFCIKDFTAGTITYTIPFKNSVSGKLRMIKGQRREKSDTYEWSTDGGETFTTIGAATGGTSDAFWKILDFEIPEANAVPAGGNLILRETVTYNASATYGGIIFQCAFAIVPQEGPGSTLPQMDDTRVVFAEGFDNIIDAKASPILNQGFLKTLTSGKYNAPSYTAEKVTTMPAIVTPENCYARPGFLQIGYADEAMAFASTNYYRAGSYKVNIGDRLKAMGLETAKLKLTLMAAGITTAFEENGNAAPVVSLTSGTISDDGKINLEMNEWKNYEFIITGADQNTVLEIASNSAQAAERAGKADNRFFVDDILVEIYDGNTGDDNPGGEPGGETKVLEFDFTIAPLSGWPTEDKYQYVAGGTKCIYPLDGVNYEFILADCGTATSARVHWNVVEGETGKNYLVFKSFYRYCGLPALAGYKLTKIEFVHGTTTSAKRGFGVAKEIEASTIHPDNENGHGYVEGGEPILGLDQGETYTFNLSKTEIGKVYYLYCSAGGVGVSSLKLSYSK